MKGFRQWACVALVGLGLFVTAGCPFAMSGKLYPISGKVQLKGGQPLPAFKLATIAFVPTNPGTAGQPAPTASGTINPDGTFTLGTVTGSSRNRKPVKGAFSGSYKVTLAILEKYPPGPNGFGVVDKKYEGVDTTDLTFTVKAADDKVVFEAEPFKKKKK